MLMYVRNQPSLQKQDYMRLFLQRVFWRREGEKRGLPASVLSSLPPESEESGQRIRGILLSLFLFSTLTAVSPIYSVTDKSEPRIKSDSSSRINSDGRKEGRKRVIERTRSRWEKLRIWVFFPTFTGAKTRFDEMANLFDRRFEQLTFSIQLFST